MDKILLDTDIFSEILKQKHEKVAAIALENNLALSTGNISHYQRIQNVGYDLNLNNWKI